MVLEVKPRSLGMLGKQSATELHPQPRLGFQRSRKLKWMTESCFLGNWRWSQSNSLILLVSKKFISLSKITQLERKQI
jgi:hypothetical protein